VHPVKSRRTEYAELTRAALLPAAADAFVRDGYNASSTVSIAAAARVTKGALYRHFTDKQSLFEAVLDAHQKAAQKKVLAAASHHRKDPWAGALAALSVTLDVCADPVASRLIDVEGPLALGWRRFRESESTYTLANVRLLLQALIDDGIYPSTIPVTATAHLVTGMITQAGVTLAEAPARPRKRIRDEFETAIRMLMLGLRVG
jgi:AcrR family transcriptional regulator